MKCSYCKRQIEQPATIIEYKLSGKKVLKCAACSGMGVYVKGELRMLPKDELPKGK
jgi:hypothetical protein